MKNEIPIQSNERAIDTVYQNIKIDTDLKLAREASLVSETDFVSRCTIISPLKLKRLQSVDGKLSKLSGSPIKQGLFQVSKYSLFSYFS